MIKNYEKRSRNINYYNNEKLLSNNFYEINKESILQFHQRSLIELFMIFTIDMFYDTINHSEVPT